MAAWSAMAARFVWDPIHRSARISVPTLRASQRKPGHYSADIALRNSLTTRRNSWPHPTYEAKSGFRAKGELQPLPVDSDSRMATRGTKLGDERLLRIGRVLASLFPIVEQRERRL
jgi:hypothetical protein